MYSSSLYLYGPAAILHSSPLTTMDMRPVYTTVSYTLSCIIGPILWGHSGPLCHALSLLLWTSMRRRCAIVATPGEWQCKIRTGGVRRLAVPNGPKIFQMLLIVIYHCRIYSAPTTKTRTCALYRYESRRYAVNTEEIAIRY